MIQWSARERGALCDLALDVGPLAPTLCAGWSVDELLTHLVVRERHLLGAASLVSPLPAGLLARATRSWSTRDFGARVELVRRGGLLPTHGSLGDLVNLLEFAVHRQDIARANGVSSQPLPPAFARALLRELTRHRRRLAQRVTPGIGVLLVDPMVGAVDLRRGPDIVVVTGPALELTLWAFGRGAHADVEVRTDLIDGNRASDGSCGRGPAEDLAATVSTLVGGR